MATYILSVVGSDRPGLTQALANAVLAADGNWLESHLSRLGGLYVGSVLVDLADDRLEALAAAVREVDAQGLEVRIAPASDAGPPPGDTLLLSLVGQDRPGIVHEVTTVLSRLGANIEAFDTRLSVEPHSGGPLFHLEAQVRLPLAQTAGEVRAALEAMSAEIMVDITLAERLSAG